MVIQAGNTLFYMGKRYTIPAGMPIANWTPEAVKKYIIPNQTPTLPILPNTNQARIPTDVREENGALNIFGGAVFTGIGAIALYTVLGVACPPALLIAGVAASSGAIVYGSSMFMEGVDEISLAQQGDTVTKAFNPIRDTIFDGDQGDYDLFGAISTAGSIVSAQAASGYAESAVDTSQQADDAADADGIWEAGKKAFERFEIDDAYVKPKHLSSTGGNGAKFLAETKDEAEVILKKAIQNGEVVSILDNGLTSQGNMSYEIIIDAKETIGTKGESMIKIVISEDGGMLSAYPIK